MHPDPLLARLAPRIRCRVLFTEERLSSMVVDCVVAAGRGGQPLPPGTPFAVEVAIGQEAWTSAARTVIERWAGEDRLVDLQFRERENRSQVWASDGDTGMLFDLTTYAGA